MQIVSNTSPILNLAIINRLDLLHRQFSKVIIPEGVLTELKADFDLPGSRNIQNSLAEGWLSIQKISDHKVFKLLSQQLDFGESEAIALALELGQKSILIDERNARQVALSMGLEPVGIVGILLKAYKQKDILDLESEIIILKEKAGFYISNDLFKSILSHI